MVNVIISLLLQTCNIHSGKRSLENQSANGNTRDISSQRHPGSLQNSSTTVPEKRQRIENSSNNSISGSSKSSIVSVLSQSPAFANLLKQR